MKKSSFLLISGVITIFSLFFVTQSAQAIYHHIDMDGYFDDWRGIDPLISDDFEATPYAYPGTYWHWKNDQWVGGVSSDHTIPHTNHNRMLDLLRFRMVHDIDNIYIRWDFATDFMGYWYNSSPDALGGGSYNETMRSPADFDHDTVWMIDKNRDGSYEYYFVLNQNWKKGDYMVVNGDYPGQQEEALNRTGYFYKDNGDGVYKGQENEILIHQFSSSDMKVERNVDTNYEDDEDFIPNSVRQEVQISRQVIFGDADINWGDTIAAAYVSHSESVEQTDSADYTFDPPPFTASIITGAGPSGGPHVRSFDNRGNIEYYPFNLFAYAKTYRGGVRVAIGDIDTDGKDEIITGTGENGGPHLRVFEKDGTQRGIEFFPFDENFRGGMDVASGDFDGDGKDDIAVSQFSKGQAWVKVYKYNDAGTILFENNVFGSAECGATVAMGDVDLDGRDEIIVGAGTGGGPQIRVFDYDSNHLVGIPKPIQFFAFHPDSRTGIDVATGDVDGDGKAEIAASQLKNGQAWVKVYRYNDEQTVLGEWNAYGNPEVGANVDMADINLDGYAEVLTGAGDGGGPQVLGFEYDGTPLSTNFFAYDEGFRGGVDIAGGCF